jgi:selenoprotein W-related protein
LAQLILDRFKNRVSELTLLPSGGGAFEIKVNDEQIYSKLETGRFPSESAVVEDIGKNL